MEWCQYYKKKNNKKRNFGESYSFCKALDAMMRVGSNAWKFSFPASANGFSKKKVFLAKTRKTGYNKK